MTMSRPAILILAIAALGVDRGFYRRRIEMSHIPAGLPARMRAL